MDVITARSVKVGMWVSSIGDSDCDSEIKVDRVSYDDDGRVVITGTDVDGERGTITLEAGDHIATDGL